MKIFKFTIFFLLFTLVTTNKAAAFAVESSVSKSLNFNGCEPVASVLEAYKAPADMKALPSDMAQMNLEKFLALTPSSYKEMTGKKLGFIKSLELKAAQKFIKKKVAGKGELSKGVYILLAIIGLGFIGMGINDHWSGSDWVICLVLSLLFWLPGLIYALIKMKKYY